MGDNVDYLYEPSGSELHWDGLKAKPEELHASLVSSRSPAPAEDAMPAQAAHPAARSGLAGTKAADAGGYRPSAPAPHPTNDELLRQAHEMIDRQSEQHSAALANGPSVGERGVPKWLEDEMAKQR